jgi:hypothetical protein
MRVYRSIIRFNSMSTKFYEFQRFCTHKYSKFGKLSSLDRCNLINSKKECNEKNCPLYKNN